MRAEVVLTRYQALHEFQIATAQIQCGVDPNLHDVQQFRVIELVNPAARCCDASHCVSVSTAGADEVCYFGLAASGINHQIDHAEREHIIGPVKTATAK